VRRVSSSGFIKLHAKRVFLSLALAGQQVGFEEVDDGLWSIYLAGVLHLADALLKASIIINNSTH
jgi:hypothetical protein